MCKQKIGFNKKVMSHHVKFVQSFSRFLLRQNPSIVGTELICSSLRQMAIKRLSG